MLAIQSVCLSLERSRASHEVSGVFNQEDFRPGASPPSAPVAVDLRIHLIALTGYGSDEDRRRSLESGFDVHLVTPIEPAELTRLLVRVDKG